MNTEQWPPAPRNGGQAAGEGGIAMNGRYTLVLKFKSPRTCCSKSSIDMSSTTTAITRLAHDPVHGLSGRGNHSSQCSLSQSRAQRLRGRCQAPFIQDLCWRHGGCSRSVPGVPINRHTGPMSLQPSLNIISECKRWDDDMIPRNPLCKG